RPAAGAASGIAARPAYDRRSARSPGPEPRPGEAHHAEGVGAAAPCGAGPDRARPSARPGTGLQRGVDAQVRCWWPGNDPLYVAYHDHEWGVPVHDDRMLFEFLV